MQKKFKKSKDNAELSLQKIDKFKELLINYFNKFKKSEKKNVGDLKQKIKETTICSP